MLSIGQRAKILAAIPEELGGYTVKKLRKDRLNLDDYEYPSMRIAVLTQGIRVRPSTNAPIRKDYGGYQGDARQWLGEHQKATISVTVLCESDKAGTDQETPEVLDQIMYDLQQEVSIWRLDINWATDSMKIIPGSSKVTYLPHLMSQSVEHWIYPAVLDFQVEYEFSALDPTPNIHALGYDFGMPCPAVDHIYLETWHPPWYGMDVMLKGWGKTLDMDLILWKTYQEKSLGVSVILVAE